MINSENEFLPEINSNEVSNDKTLEVIADYPCCNYVKIPNNGDANCYICHVCMWEIDLFIKSEDEPSDSNNELSLR